MKHYVKGVFQNNIWSEIAPTDSYTAAFYLQHYDDAACSYQKEAETISKLYCVIWIYIFAGPALQIVGP